MKAMEVYIVQIGKTNVYLPANDLLQAAFGGRGWQDGLLGYEQVQVDL